MSTLLVSLLRPPNTSWCASSSSSADHTLWKGCKTHACAICRARECEVESSVAPREGLRKP